MLVSASTPPTSCWAAAWPRIEPSSGGSVPPPDRVPVGARSRGQRAGLAGDRDGQRPAHGAEPGTGRRRSGQRRQRLGIGNDQQEAAECVAHHRVAVRARGDGDDRPAERSLGGGMVDLAPDQRPAGLAAAGRARVQTDVDRGRHGSRHDQHDGEVATAQVDDADHVRLRAGGRAAIPAAGRRVSGRTAAPGTRAARRSPAARRRGAARHQAGGRVVGRPGGGDQVVGDHGAAYRVHAAHAEGGPVADPFQLGGGHRAPPVASA